MRVLLSLIWLFVGMAYAENHLPEDSLYTLSGRWQTQLGNEITLDALAGKPVVMALVYTGCSTACPMIIESMRRVEKKLPIARQGQINFVLVTLSPETDTPEVLKKFAEKKQLPESWRLLRGNNQTVRALSNALNSRYKKNQNQEISHSNTVTLLTSKGQIALQAAGTFTGIEPMIERLAASQEGL